MRRERMTRIGVCVLLLAAVALTGCRLAEHGRRAAIDAFASFVLDSVLQVQKAAPLTQARVSGRQAPLPVAPVAPVAAAVPVQTRQECPSSIEIQLPTPQSRIAIDLKPAVTIELCGLPRLSAADLARVNVEARMALAERRGVQIRRIVVVADPSTAL